MCKCLCSTLNLKEDRVKINIITVGKLKKSILDLFNTYKRKCLFYVDINVIEIKEQNNTNKDIQKTKETNLILEKIPKKSMTFLCSLQGKQLNSMEFSKIINKAHLTFVIGGSNGVCESKFINKISFSKMTFPHQLFRVILIEQIYRALTIKNNLKYHK